MGTTHTSEIKFAAGSRVDFFKNAESNAHLDANRNHIGIATFNVHQYDAVLDRDMDLTEIIALAATVCGRGSHRAGTFEIQTDEGIITHATGKNLVGTPAKNIVFKTWDELEAEEAA